MEPIDLHPQPGGRGRGDLDGVTLHVLHTTVPLAFLSIEKDGCQASKPSTIILYFMFKEPFNIFFINLATSCNMLLQGGKTRVTRCAQQCCKILR